MPGKTNETPTVDVVLLLELARLAREDRGGHDPARIFVARLVGALETRHGTGTADLFARAIGFDHLVSET